MNMNMLSWQEERRMCREERGGEWCCEVEKRGEGSVARTRGEEKRREEKKKNDLRRGN
jgi:hypothetical protein